MIMGDTKFYSYKEIPQKDGKVVFGWTLSEELSLDQDLIVSYSSKSKKVSEEDAAWSRKEGMSASSVADYEKYLFALTGLSSEDFLEKWSDNLGSLEESRRGLNPNYREGEGSLLLSVAALLNNEKEKFSKFGRIYKRVNGNAFFSKYKKK